MTARFKKFRAHVVALGKTYECDLFAETLEEATAQAEKDAPAGTTSITIEPALEPFSQPTLLQLDIEAALNPKPKVEVFKQLDPIKTVDLGGMVRNALEAKDKIITQLKAENASLRNQVLEQRR
jgi:hypothetical protein